MTALLLVVGAVLCGLSLFLGAPLFGPSSWLAVGPLTAGALLVLAGVVSAIRAGTRVGGAGRLAVEALVIFAVVIALQLAALRMPAAVDLSSNRSNTLSEKSVDVAKKLTADVTIHALLGRDDRAFVELDALVERLERVTPHIALARSEVRAQLGEPNVVVVAGERRAPIRLVAGAPDHEELLANAIVQVTSGGAVRAYFVAGHGEPDLNADGPDGLSRLREALRVEGILAVPLPLAQVGAVPADAAALVVAGPTSALPDADAKAVREYVDAGGRALFLLEPMRAPSAPAPGGDGAARDARGARTGLEGVVGAFGIQLTDGAVIDTSPLAGLAGGPDVATGSQLEHAHPVTRPLGEALTHFAHARALVENPGPTAKVTALVQTGPEAKSGDVAGPLVLAMAAEDEVPTTLDGKARRARVVVVGDASFAQNRGVQMGANKDLAVNAVLWLAEREDRISIRPRGRGGALLLLTPSARERLALALLYGLPVALIVCGFGARAWRRR